jgi:hypothetical protein
MTFPGAGFRLIAIGAASLTLVATLPRVALAAPHGTVHLKNGGRIHGELMEVLPDEYVTVRLPDGTVRKIPWEKVGEVKETPASQPAAAVAAQPTAPVPRGPVVAPQPEPALAPVFIRSTRPNVTIGQVLARHTFNTFSTVFVGPNVITTPAVASGLSWRNLCVTPCRLELPLGRHELYVGGESYRKKVVEVDVTAANDNHFVAKPGDLGLWVFGLIVLCGGLASFVTGLTALMIGQHSGDTYGFDTVTHPAWMWGITIGGVAGAILGGVAMYGAGSTTLERDTEPPQRQAGSPPRAPALRYAGSF